MRPTDVDSTGGQEEPAHELTTSPGAAWTPPAGSRPLSAQPPEPPAWPPADPLVEDPRGDEAADARGPSPRRAALLGAAAGGLVAALVATGVTVALDEDVS